MTMPHHGPRGGKREAYNELLADGRRRLTGDEAEANPLAALVEEFRARRAAGEKLSIRAFCGKHRLSQKRFEARLRHGQPEETEADPTVLAYYQRPEVQQALYRWAQGRLLALHFARGAVGLGFRSPEDVLVLAAACKTKAPTFHASVGRYEGTQLVAFELVAEVDRKGNWQACFRAVRPLVRGLHRTGIPFLVKFSGHSSAHVLVPCRGADYREAAGHFLRRIRSIVRGASYLDLSFRHPQHFLRMPYALHERTGLVSLPLTIEEYEHFTPEMARPENVTVDLARLERVLSADNSEVELADALEKLLDQKGRSLGDVPWDDYPRAKEWYVRIKSRPSFRPVLADHIPGLRPPTHYADLDF